MGNEILVGISEYIVVKVWADYIWLDNLSYAYKAAMILIATIHQKNYIQREIETKKSQYTINYIRIILNYHRISVTHAQTSKSVKASESSEFEEDYN